MRTQEDGRPHTRKEASGGPGPAHAWTSGSSLQDGGQRVSCEPPQPRWWFCHSIPLTNALLGLLGSCPGFAGPPVDALPLGPGFPDLWLARRKGFVGGRRGHTGPGLEPCGALTLYEQAHTHPFPPFGVWPWAGAVLGVLTG